MSKFKALCAAGDKLDIWLKPIQPSQEACVRLQDELGRRNLRLTESDDFQMLRADVAGEVEISWDDDVTSVSLIYAYASDRVMTQGISLLWTTPENDIPGTRYKLHLQPPFGWMNDPNGMCEIDGHTHAFYQHYPHKKRWNTMHWGHAASENLVDWVHLPVFLHPRPELLASRIKGNGAFSGSAVPLPGGSLRIFYTDREDERKPNWEWQMTCVSRDLLSAGPSQTVIEDRPPVPHFGKDMRDSYVFRGPDGLWKMLVGGADDRGGLILLYENDNIDNVSGWRYAGVLHHEPLSPSLPLECPSLIALDGAGEGLHALLFGIIGLRDPGTRRRNLSRALVGRFDGRSFVPIARHELDFATDAYAFQAFTHHSGPTMLAWAANWTDVFKDRDFMSAMTFPRRLVWRDGQLHTPVIETVSALRERPLASSADALASGIELRDGLAELVVDFARSEPFRLDFAHETYGLALIFDGAHLELHFEPPGNRVVPRYAAALAELRSLRIFIDVGLIEIYANDGALCGTKRLDSDKPVTGLRLTTKPEAVARAEVWALRPAHTGLQHAQHNPALTGHASEGD